LSSLLSTLRSWFVSGGPAAPASPTPGELLRQRIERKPAFELGRYVVMGGYDTYTGEEQDGPSQTLEALADMRDAATSYVGSPYLHPIKISFPAIDWLEMDYVSPTLGRVHVGMPAILAGRWIADDIPLMIDVAATAVVDAMIPHSQDALQPAVERLAKLAHFGDALMNALKDETGAHVTLPSPFGPADVRQHAETGAAPYAVYHLPDTKDFEDLPEGYEFQAWHHSVEIKRCRSMGYRHVNIEGTWEEWERRRFIQRGLAYFDPTPLPSPNPMRSLRHSALAVIDGRRVLTVRRTGQSVFSLPGSDESSMSTDQANEDFRPLLGAAVQDVEWLASGRVLSGSPDKPNAIVEIYRARLDGAPSPLSGLVEIHWLDIDEPDCPVDDSMRHSLLPAIRRKMDRNP